MLQQTLRAQGKEVVPLDLQLDKRRHILVISGPNAGGKSVCLKTTGIIQYMFQCGFLVPASENSELPLFRNLMMYGSIPGPNTWIACIFCAVASMAIGLLVFRKLQKNFILYI